MVHSSRVLFELRHQKFLLLAGLSSSKWSSWGFKQSDLRWNKEEIRRGQRQIGRGAPKRHVDPQDDKKKVDERNAICISIRSGGCYSIWGRPSNDLNYEVQCQREWMQSSKRSESVGRKKGYGDNKVGLILAGNEKRVWQKYKAQELPSWWSSTSESSDKYQKPERWQAWAELGRAIQGNVIR